MSFRDHGPEQPATSIPYETQDYLELVDWYGRAIVHGKRGSIPSDLPPILERLNVNSEHYLKFIRRDRKSGFANYFEPVETLCSVVDRFGKAFLKGQSAAAALFSPG